MAPYWKLYPKIFPWRMKIYISISLNIFLSIYFYTMLHKSSISLFILLLHGFTISVIDTVIELIYLYVLLCTNLLFGWGSSATMNLHLGQTACVTQPYIPCVSSRGAVPLVSLTGECSSGFEPSFKRFLSFKHKSQRKYPGLFETTIAPSDARWQWEMSSSWLKHSNYFSHLTSVFIQTYCPGLCWHGLKSHFLLKFFIFFRLDISVGCRDGNSGAPVPFYVPTAFFHIVHMKWWPEGALTSTAGAAQKSESLNITSSCSWLQNLKNE